MNNIKVSVIIPVYNVEPYLGECLDSIINQTLKEIEIICVDDCSTDNSYQILEEYAKKDDRIIILKNEKNSGLAHTRNNGIEKSTGKYVGFIDSDDYISLDYFENLYNTAKKYNSDITTTLNVYYDDNGNIYEKFMNINNFLSKKEKKNKKLHIEGKSEISIENEKNNTKEYMYVTSTNKIHKKDFLKKNNISFFEIESGSEDLHFYIKEILNNPKTSYNHKSIYYHRKRVSSLMNSISLDLKHPICTIKFMENILEYTINFHADLIKYVIKLAISNIINLLDNVSQKKEYYKYVYDFFKKIDIDNCDASIIGYFNFNIYLAIILNDSYEKYLLQKELFESIDYIKNKINKLDSRVKLFGIENFNGKIIIYFFGIKITIKLKHYNSSFKDQTRPDQTRPDQTRPDQTRPDQTR